MNREAKEKTPVTSEKEYPFENWSKHGQTRTHTDFHRPTRTYTDARQFFSFSSFAIRYSVFATLYSNSREFCPFTVGVETVETVCAVLGFSPCPG